MRKVSSSSQDNGKTDADKLRKESSATFERILCIEATCYCLVQYLTEPEIWLLDVMFDLGFKHPTVHDTVDPYTAFERGGHVLFTYRSLLFLQWCIKYHLRLKRICIHISEYDSSTHSQRHPNDLLLLMKTYLEMFGESLLSISFKFTFNCSTACDYICVGFDCCKNLIMFALEAPRVEFSRRHFQDIIRQSEKCRNLRVWCFIDGTKILTPDLTKETDHGFNEQVRVFCKSLGTRFGQDGVRQLFLNRSYHQGCYGGIHVHPQHALPILLSMRENNQLFICNVGHRSDIREWENGGEQENKLLGRCIYFLTIKYVLAKT